MNYTLVSVDRNQSFVGLMCETLSAICTDYYYQRVSAQRKSVERQVLFQLIEEIEESSAKSGGMRRLSRVLLHTDCPVGRESVRWLIALARGIAHHRCKYKMTAYSNQRRPFDAIVSGQRFWVDAPNWTWAGSMACISTGEVWRYPAALSDQYLCIVFDWTKRNRMKVRLVCDALSMVAWNRRMQFEIIYNADGRIKVCRQEAQSTAESH